MQPLSTLGGPARDFLIVLGRGWQRPTRRRAADCNPRLSIETKMGTLAAGEMFRSGGIEWIILSGGRTAGRKHLSEACAMKQYLKQKFPCIPDAAILLEESLDTAGNAKEVGRLLHQDPIRGFTY